MGVFANALSMAVGKSDTTSHENQQKRPGLTAWLLDRIQRRALQESCLTLVQRINLAPRQTVALIEADGQRLLVATSADGTPSFYLLKATVCRSVATVATRGCKTDSESGSL